MSSPDWSEIHLSEDPAVELLASMGYSVVPPEDLEKERGGLKEVVLTSRLENALKRINPWLAEEHIAKAVRQITHVPAASFMEANEKIYTSLVHGVSMEEDGQAGRKSRNVYYIDFDNPANNEFMATRQFKVAGSKENIVCDVVIFINGIPVSVIECKSPTIYEPINQAIDQLTRYQELKDEFKGRGAPRFFETMQIIIATCGQSAKFATAATLHRFYSEWVTPYPDSLDKLHQNYTAKLFGKPPNPQDVLIYSLLSPQNILDMVRNFITFEIDGGRTVKKIARYQQVIAVNNALQRVLNPPKPGERGGVVWHTQGSGKSLSMLWLAVKLRRATQLENPMIVIVTDRVDLDNQIVGTFGRCGFPNPVQANSVKELKDLLRAGNGQTIMTTIQKFQELNPDENLSQAHNILVMVDEAHRTQYKNMAANMRQALPNACFLGFTGTPIDKNDRSTLQTFGSYIHTYTIEQAVRDGATVPIYYESRLPEVRVEGENLDVLFDRYFKDYGEKERAEIKQRYGTEKAVAMAKSRLRAICLDVIRHYEQFILPNGFKAQIVTQSRDAAAMYKEILDELNAPPSAVLISGDHNDSESLAKHHKTPAEEKEIIRSFKEDPVGKLALIIVCDKLLTGFDAPVEQVMYLDSPLKEHTLLQAIARVNRTADKKDYGLIVDYWGVSRDLQEALGVFTAADVENAMKPKEDELPRLEQRHRAVMRFFDKVNKSDLEACLNVLEPPDVRADFDAAFLRFSQSMDMVLPDPAALRFGPDLKWLGKLRNAARARFRDEKIDFSACGAKVRQLIDEHIKTEGIERLLEPVSIFSKKFDEVVESLTTSEAKASEMEHAIRHEIHVHLQEDPVFYESLKERLQKIIDDKKQERITAAEELKRLNTLVKEMRNIGVAAQELGLSEDEYALYKLLKSEKVLDSGSPVSQVREPSAPYGKERDTFKDMTQIIMKSLEDLVVIDWVYKEGVQREMRQRIKGILRERGYRFEDIEPLTLKVMDLAKVRLRK